MRNKDGYSYHVIPHSEAKGLAGKPGKDLTSKVVFDFSTKLVGIKTKT